MSIAGSTSVYARKRLQRQASPTRFRSIEEDETQFWEQRMEVSFPTPPITAIIAPRTEAILTGKVLLAPEPGKSP